MGSAMSSLRTLRIAIWALLREKKSFDALLERVAESPGIPVPNPSRSFWILPPHDGLSRLEPKLPKTADVVIIGSGITGTALARELLARKPELKVAILEARGVCEGATGRNGGHIKESPFENYRRLKKVFGINAAAKIVRFRLRHTQETIDAAEEEGCTEHAQVRVVEGCDVFLDPEVDKDGKEGFDMWKYEMRDDAEEFNYWGAEETRKKTGIPTAFGCVAGPAGALWPYRLCTNILSRLVKEHEGFSLVQFTPVMSVEYHDQDSEYVLDTSRGTIRTKTLVHATNGHVAHYLPGLRGKVFPVRAQMSAQSPPKTAPENPGGKRSWIMIYNGGYDYLTQLPTGEMMLGGGFAQLGTKKALDRFGNADDRGIDKFTGSHLGSILPYLFSGGDQQADNWEGVDVKNMWTGTLGFSSDLLPWVGKVPESVSGRRSPREMMGTGDVCSGEWVCAGYSGEGMVNALGCATALARMLLGEDGDDLPVVPKLPSPGSDKAGGVDDDDDDQSWASQPVIDWFPKQMLITEERVKKADITSLFDMIED